MSTGLTSGGLAQEIYDEFLLCKMCFGEFKRPKSLNCLHVFCAKCIEDQFKSKTSHKRYSAEYGEFTCPLCYKRTPIPTGGVQSLQDNFTVSSLIQLIGPQCPKPSQSPCCDICKKVSKKQRDAACKCLDCAKMLCEGCAKDHRETKVTSGHSLFGVQVEKDVQCKEHPEEAVRFYCIPCDACVCVLCTFNVHRDHQVIQFVEAVSRCRDRIAALLASCRVKASDCDRRTEAVTSCEEVITRTTEKIKEAANKCVQEVRNAELRLKEELLQMVGPEVVSLIERKKELVSLADGLRSTCDITDIIVTGKDMELLLLKKDVESKLSSMMAIQLPELPMDYAMDIDFLPGDVDLGYLCDQENPVVPIARVNKSSSNPVRLKTRKPLSSDEIREIAVQTENIGSPVSEKVEGSAAKAKACSGAERNGAAAKGVTGQGPVFSMVSLNVRVSPPPKAQQQEPSDKEPRRRRRRDPSLSSNGDRGQTQVSHKT